ncbi:hypothetical protein LINPERHAP1_LOCUS21551, partial [Linum perenne]
EDGFPRYKRSNNGRHILKKGVQLDNRFVVPYNRYLLLRFDAHINVEYCNKSSAQPSTLDSTASNLDMGHVDEIKAFMDCRYITPGEACW